MDMWMFPTLLETVRDKGTTHTEEKSDTRIKELCWL